MDATQARRNQRDAKSIGDGARLADVELQHDTVFRPLDVVQHRLKRLGAGGQPSKNVVGRRHWDERAALRVGRCRNRRFIHARTSWYRLRQLGSSERVRDPIGRIRQTVFRGLQRVDQQFKLTMTASNLMRLARMPGAVPHGAMQ